MSYNCIIRMDIHHTKQSDCKTNQKLSQNFLNSVIIQKVLAPPTSARAWPRKMTVSSFVVWFHCLHVVVPSPWQLVLFTLIFLSSFFFFSSTFALFSSSICLSSFCAFMLLISVTICSLI